MYFPNLPPQQLWHENVWSIDISVLWLCNVTVTVETMYNTIAWWSLKMLICFPFTAAPWHLVIIPYYHIFKFHLFFSIRTFGPKGVLTTVHGLTPVRFSCVSAMNNVIPLGDYMAALVPQWFTVCGFDPYTGWSEWISTMYFTVWYG